MVSSVLMLLFAVNLKAQCFINPISVTMEVGETKVFTVTSGQAYYWTITGPGTIISGQTSQSVTIQATGAGTITLYAVVFVNGQCFECHTYIPCNPCGVQIQELIPMRYGTSCHCWEKRGDYIARDCHGNIVPGDWEISPNGNNGSCIYSGCNTPFSGRIHGSTIKPLPTCNWAGMNTTIRLYQQNTNNLLASKTVTIGWCKGKYPKKVAMPDKVLTVLNNQPGGDTSFEINATELMDVRIECIALSSGKNHVLYSTKSVDQGIINVDFPNASFENGMYLIIVKSGTSIIAKEKILNLK